MAQFLKVKTSEEVLEILRGLEPLPAERVGISSAYGRILAEEIRAPEPVPPFDRAVMDGYAVRARDTFGASETLPALLELSGEISMGMAASLKVEPGKAVAIPTGGMLPEGADAVSMVEYSYPLDEKTIEITKPVAPWDHVLRRGEDIEEGMVLFHAGRHLRSQDIGVLAALGIHSVSVYARPRVAIFSTGDEIVPVETAHLPLGKIRDINSFTLAGQVMEAGGIVGERGLVADNLGTLVEACRSALENHDVLILSGGSSVGVRDFTLKVLDALPNAELLVHGIAIRPGKPTILARIGKKVFWGLPGQPMSAMMICRAFVMPSLLYLQGISGGTGMDGFPGNSCNAILGNQLPSVHGRTDYIPVTLAEEGGRLIATPIFGKSAMISSLSQADGYVIVPEHVEGLDRGTAVRVHLFRAIAG